MKPELTTHDHGPHARVACVACHVGPGVNWFVRSKLSGSYQVYAVAFNKYPRPIPTPIKNLRPPAKPASNVTGRKNSSATWTARSIIFRATPPTRRIPSGS